MNFFFQAQKLVLAVYQVGCSSGGSAGSSVRFESVLAECGLPWLTPALAAITTALHLTHALKDKVKKGFFYYLKNWAYYDRSFFSNEYNCQLVKTRLSAVCSFSSSNESLFTPLFSFQFIPSVIYLAFHSSFLTSFTGKTGEEVPHF